MKKIKWELTPYCNLNCKHCGAFSEEKKKILTFEENKLILHKLVNEGLQKIVLITKEPTMYPDWLEFVEYCSLIGVCVTIVTNGTLLDEEKLRRLYKCRIELLTISLEGISISTNDIVRGTGVFEKVIKVFEIIENLNDEFEYNFPLGVQINLNQYNLKECERIIDFFEKTPIITLSIGMLALAGKAKENINLQSQYEKTIAASERIINIYIHKKKLPFNLLFKMFSVYEAIYYNFHYNINLYAFAPKCGALDGSYSIMSDGTLCSCNLLKDEEIILNELLDIGHISNINKLNNFTQENRKQYLEYKTKGFCKECRFNENCELCLLVSQKDTEMKKQRYICQYYNNKLKAIVKNIIEEKEDIRIIENIYMMEKNDCIILYTPMKDKVTIKGKQSMSLVKNLYLKNKLIKIDSKYQELVIEALLYNNMIAKKENIYE